MIVFNGLRRRWCKLRLITREQRIGNLAMLGRPPASGPRIAPAPRGGSALERARIAPAFSWDRTLTKASAMRYSSFAGRHRPRIFIEPVFSPRRVWHHDPQALEADQRRRIGANLGRLSQPTLTGIAVTRAVPVPLHARAPGRTNTTTNRLRLAPRPRAAAGAEAVARAPRPPSPRAPHRGRCLALVSRRGRHEPRAPRRRDSPA